MVAYIARRLVLLLPVVFGILLVTFLFKAFIPTDAVSALYQGTVTEDAAAESMKVIRAKYDLDKPWYQQFAIYAWKVAHGDLGESIRTRRPIVDEIGFRYVNTLILTFAALGVAILVGVVTGVVSAYYKDSWLDVAAMTLGMFGLSMPAFFFGLVLILVFSVWLQWLPVISTGGAMSLLLPAVTLGLIESAPLSRITRSSMLDALNKEFVRTARAKGLNEWIVVFRHALPNALLSIITIVGLQIGGLLGGAFIIEVVFGWHGIGELAIKAIQWRDFTITQAVVLIGAGTYVLVNLAVDVLYTWIDPRIGCA